MTESKTVFVERPNAPLVAPNTVVLYAREDMQLYMKNALGQVSQLICAATDVDLTDVPKIDSEATDGLAGVNNSLAYRVHEIERHFHSYESWFEEAGTPSGEVHVADRIGTVGGGGAFRVDAGNNTWGGWVQVLGSSDTPAIAGSVKFDLHRLEISATERNEVYYVQIALGTSGAAALAAGDYTEAVFKAASNQVDSGPVTIQTRRKNVGTKTWVRCMCPGQDTGTLDFYIGLHEYEG